MNRNKITKSLSDLAMHYDDFFDKALEILSKLIASHVPTIKYNMGNNAIHYPLHLEASIRAASDKFLGYFVADLKAKGRKIKDLDEVKRFLAKELGTDLITMSTDDYQTWFAYIIKKSSVNQDTKSGVMRYLKSLGMKQSDISEGFGKYIEFYRKVNIDDVPAANQEEFRDIFNNVFADISSIFEIKFIEDSANFQLSIMVKEHLQGLEYDAHGQRSSLFEVYTNNYVMALLSKIMDEAIYPIQILIDNNLFMLAENKILGREKVKALKIEVSIHEILHALGLRHPSEEDEVLHLTSNKASCTIMEGDSSDRYYVENSFFASPGPSDIVALEGHGYRLKESAYDGDTIYYLGGDSNINFKRITTLIDRDGYNILDTSAYNGADTAYVHLAYGCFNPSIVGKEIYFLDYDSKFSELRTGNAWHKIDDNSNHDMRFVLGEGKVELSCTNLGHKTLVNFDESRHKILLTAKLEYKNDGSGSCRGQLGDFHGFSVTYIDHACEELSIQGVVGNGGEL